MPKIYRRSKILARNTAWASIASHVVERVADVTAVTVDEMMSRTRRSEIAEARQIAAWILRKSELSLPQIARNIGLSNHTTIIHAIDKVTHDALLKSIAMRIKTNHDLDGARRDWLGRHYKTWGPKQPRPRSRGDMAADLVEAGTHSHVTAARALGISHKAVSQACIKRGLRGRTAVGQRAVSRAARAHSMRGVETLRRTAATARAARGLPDYEALLRMTREDGITYSDLAARYGVTRSAVAGLIARAKRAEQRGNL